MRHLVSILAMFAFLFPILEGKEPAPLCEGDYQHSLLEQVGKSQGELSKYPTFQYPNKGFEKIFEFCPESKILLFGYGSLINKKSASRNVKAEALESMQPAIAFGVKRMFNYQAKKTDHWGTDLDHKEKAMLNLAAAWNMKSMVNGVVMEIDREDLASLISREQGYDLVPILIASWNEVIAKDPEVEIKVAYTFVSPYEAREGVLYTSTQYYPVTNYLIAVQEGASEYGLNFVDFWNATTYLADGKTTVLDWDKKTFTGILCTKQIIET